MQRSESIKGLAVALAKFQMEVENPKNSATNPQFKSKYAPLDVVINTVKPLLAKHGLSFMQSTGGQLEAESISVTTMLIHESGEWIESDPLILPAHQIKGGGKKDFNAQGAGSAISYGRRYSLSAILGISSEDDDDGNGASNSGNQSKGASGSHSQAKATEKSDVAAKWKALAGSDDGFEKFYQEQTDKGYNNNQMNVFLQKKIDEKQK